MFLESTDYTSRKADELVVISTYDKVDGVYETIDKRFDPTTGSVVQSQRTQFTLAQLQAKKTELEARLADIVLLIKDVKAL